MTRILKRGQKTYFKEDVVTCLADETMQKIFTQSEYGNRTVWMEELQEEAKERFNMDFTDEDYKSFKTLIAKDEYLLSLDDNAGILESKALDIVVGYGRVKGGVSGLWEKEQAEYDQKEQFDQEFKQNAVNYCLTHPELSRKECAKNLGIGDSTLYRWKQEAKANNNQAAFTGSGNLTEAELENRRLKRELKDTQDALEILKKAISILGE